MLKIKEEDKPVLFALGALSLFLAGVYAEATSQVPVPCFVKHESSPPNNEANSEEQQTVAPLNAPAPQADESECEGEPSSDWWLVWLTGGLVLVGAAQFWMFFRQLGYMKQGVKGAAEAAMSAAEQTRLAREEFAANHRPRLIARNVRNPDAAIGQPFDIRFEVINIGGTDAILTASKIGVHLVPDGASFHTLPLPMVGESPASEDLGTVRIGPGAVLRGTFTRGVWTKEMLAMYSSANEGFFFGAKILYQDPTGRLHGRLGVFRRFERPSMRFRSVQDPEFEYDD